MTKQDKAKADEKLAEIVTDYAMSTGNDTSKFGRNAAVASAIALTLFATAAAPQPSYAQEARAVPITATMPAKENSMLMSDNAFNRAVDASKGTGRVGVFIETGPGQEKGYPAAEWAKAVEEGLNRRGNAVHMEIRGGAAIAEPGRIAIFVKGNMVYSSGLSKFNQAASQALNDVDFKQEQVRSLAGLPKDTFPIHVTP